MYCMNGVRLGQLDETSQSLAIVLARWPGIQIRYRALPEVIREFLREGFELVDAKIDDLEEKAQMGQDAPPVIDIERAAEALIPEINAFEEDLVNAQNIVAGGLVLPGAEGDGTPPDGTGAAPVAASLTDVAGGIGILAVVGAAALAISSA